MKRKSLFITLFAIATVVLLAASALAAKPTNPGKPTTTTTTAPTSDYWTCQARVDNGAVWPLGIYDGAGFYTGDGPVLCVDIITDHLEVTSWLVEWSGTTAKGTVKGLKLVFEEEVHGTVYDEAVFQVESSGSEPWKASWSTPDVQNLVFVMTFTIRPLPTYPEN